MAKEFNAQGYDEILQRVEVFWQQVLVKAKGLSPVDFLAFLQSDEELAVNYYSAQKEAREYYEKWTGRIHLLKK